MHRLFDANIFIKHENQQRTGSFKIRGAINLLLQMEKQGAGELVTASTGNHGLAIASAANIFGFNATIVLPRTVNQGKVNAISQAGGKVCLSGRNFEEALKHAQQIAKENGVRYVDPVNDLALMAGFGTYTLEILEDLPDVDVIFVPIGSGCAAAGTCVVTKSLKPSTKVIGVGPERAPAAYLSWKRGRIITAHAQTKADALATSTGYEPPQRILRQLLNAFVLVSEPEMEQAIVLSFERTQSLTEQAGAAALAGALKIRTRLRGKNVVLIMTAKHPALTGRC